MAAAVSDVCERCHIDWTFWYRRVYTVHRTT